MLEKLGCGVYFKANDEVILKAMKYLQDAGIFSQSPNKYWTKSLSKFDFYLDISARP